MDALTFELSRHGEGEPSGFGASAARTKGATDDESGADTTQDELTSVGAADVATTKKVIASGLGLNRRAVFPGLPAATKYVAAQFHAVAKDDLRADLVFWAPASAVPAQLELLLADEALHIVATRAVPVAPRAAGGDTSFSAGFKAPKDGTFSVLLREKSGAPVVNVRLDVVNTALVDDPFDARSCQGAPMKAAESGDPGDHHRRAFPPADVASVRSVFTRRRSCPTPGTCGAWHDAAVLDD